MAQSKERKGMSALSCYEEALFYSKKLRNGLELFVIDLDSSDDQQFSNKTASHPNKETCIRVDIKVGSDGYFDALEGWKPFSKSARLRNLCHLMEHVQAGYTSSQFQNAQEVIQMFGSWGCSGNAQVSPYLTSFYTSCLDQYAPQVLALMLSSWTDWHLDRYLLKREVNAMKQELLSNVDLTWEPLWETLRAVMYQDKAPNRCLTWMDLARDSDHITEEDLTHFRSCFYVPQNMVITVIGSHALKLVYNIERALEVWSPPSNVTFRRGVEKPYIKLPCALEKAYFIDIPSSSQSNISIIFKTFDLTVFNYKQRIKHECIGSVLASSSDMSSRLMQLLRGRFGLVYRATTELSPDEVHPDLSYLIIEIQPEIQHTWHICDLVFEELENVKLNGITFDELKKFKNKAKYSLLEQKSDKRVNALAGIFCEEFVLTEHITSLQQRFELVEEISLEEINATASKLFSDHNMIAFVMAGPLQKLKQL